MSTTAARHTEEDIHEVEVACFRTDYSDDAKWERLLELAQTVKSDFRVCRKGSGGRSSQSDEEDHNWSFMCVMEGPELENMTAQDLEPISSGTFVVADRQSMQDDTFLLAHTYYEYDEETGDMSTEYVLKTGRYPAFDIIAPLINLPIANMDFEDFIPYSGSPCGI
ncbi:hypothetical protein INT44_002899 [Umbelopsis vinacea]|uniref:DUF6924 domain-containing protein n=1 Tax=Umbelopsis vinacea TaxID=44442 RepID=A0A8H7Q7D8_9FUNG|nr:hypothetical protein INT44_002899 [Umbelopsis vinacea]